MGLQQARTLSRYELDESSTDHDDGAVLNGAQLLSHLESDLPSFGDSADAGDPAKGIACALLVGGIVWTIAIAAYFTVA